MADRQGGRPHLTALVPGAVALRRQLRHPRSHSTDYRSTRLVPRNLDSDEAARIRERLARLTAERQALKTRLAELENANLSVPYGDPNAVTLTERSLAADKIALFRSISSSVPELTLPRSRSVHTLGKNLPQSIDVPRRCMSVPVDAMTGKAASPTIHGPTHKLTSTWPQSPDKRRVYRLADN